MKKKLIILGIIAVVLGGAGYYATYYKVPTGWKTYKNTTYGFEFKYPPELEVISYEKLSEVNHPLCLGKKYYEIILQDNVAKHKVMRILGGLEAECLLWEGIGYAPSPFPGNIVRRYRPEDQDNKNLSGSTYSFRAGNGSFLVDAGSYPSSEGDEELVYKILTTLSLSK